MYAGSSNTSFQINVFVQVYDTNGAFTIYDILTPVTVIPDFTNLDKFERNNFSGAIKLYTLGIDQMQQSITILNTSFKLAKLMAGRAKSNLKIAQLRRSKEYCELSLKDTDFILKSESFDIKSVKYTDLDFYQQLVKLNDQAQILLKNLDMAEISRV